MARYLVLGTGMGEAVAYVLLKYASTEHVTIADIDKERLARATTRLAHPKLRSARIDVTVLPQVKKLMRGHDVVVAAVSYEFNAVLTKAAIEEGVHFLDLGGNNDIVAKQFALSDVARDAGVTVIPDNGIAPGAVSILAMHALALLDTDTADLLQIRVGGLPRVPIGPLGYAKVFSIRGLVNEYVEPALILRDGEETLAEPMGDVETVFFPGLGDLEAAFTSGGSSTLTKSLAGRVRNLDYKTLRYPGHWKKVRLLHRLGLFGPGTIGKGMTYRDVGERLLENVLPATRDDLIAVIVTAVAGDRLVRLRMVALYDPEADMPAMHQTTGYSAAIVAMMVGEGVIKERGTLRLEDCVRPPIFIGQWKWLGLHLAVEQEQFSCT